METNQPSQFENSTQPSSSTGEESVNDQPNFEPETQSENIVNQSATQASLDNGLQFKELENYGETPLSIEELNGQNNYSNPGDEFKTGHWAIEMPAEEKTHLPKPVIQEAARDLDFVETIPPETPANQPLPEAILPETVEEIDPQATALNAVAFTPGGTEVPHETQPVIVTKPKTMPSPSIKPAAKPVSGKTQPTPVSGQAAVPPRKTKKKKGCLSRGVLIVLVVLLLLLLAGGIFAISQYLDIASTLPSVDELQNRASQFETTYILDRNGTILYEIVDPNAGKRTYVPLERISPYLIAATIATEDKEYYNHPGFDVLALARALYANYTSGEIVSGASTITQQLARLLLLTDERFEQFYERKAREIILAAEITRRYTKEQVLELYLNEIFYGNLS
jgi:hypothetical protein